MAGRGERLVRDWGQADERRLRGRRSRVVLTSRRWCQVCGGEVGPTGRGPAIFVGDGDKKARSPGRARNRLLKPLRAGMLGVSGKPVVTTAGAAVYSFLPTRLRVHWAPGIPHALTWAEDKCTTRAHRAAGMWRCVLSSLRAQRSNPACEE